VSKSLATAQDAAGDTAAIAADDIMTRLALAFVLERIGPRFALQLAQAALEDLKIDIRNIGGRQVALAARLLAFR
jgi:hypothetical protein